MGVLVTWLRLDPAEFWALDEVVPLDIEAAGLYWWLVCRSWNGGAIRDEPEFYKAALRGKCPNFDALWLQVRTVLTEIGDGELRSEWLETTRAESLTKLRSDATRKALERAGRRKSKGLHRSPTDSNGVRRNPATDVQDVQDERTDEQVERAKRARVEVEAWAKVFAEFPTLDTPEIRTAYRDLIAMRKRRRYGEWQPDTLRSNLRDAEPHGPAALLAAFRESERSEYRGVFPAKHSGRKVAKGGQPTLGDLIDAQRRGGAA